ncbi:hypothetical protein [Labilibaculum antarcticum]|uniref:PKD domain-containing protein n=1 Tax=Labilibaculum antarcticum TaxID=1717717 RepID=A0A1Y1CL46_9BACT|nr:hypothetical protein [Labilibaculum antarcticum]BAX81128.1 hypothetical protein ALGA_2821 [Labilibaculum antarcticum]
MNKNQHPKILKSVEKKFNKGKSQSWKNKDFEDLSFRIHQKTKVLISVATLKRLFKKVKTSDSYSPQESTIGALIDYADYQEVSKTLNLKWLYVALPFIAIIIGTLFILSNKQNQVPKQEASMGKLKLLKLEGKCPTTAFFEFTIPKGQDTASIDFGDKTKRIPIKDQKQISHFYAYPGYFEAVLLSGKQKKSEHVKIIAPTEGWLAMSHYFKEDQDGRYYPIPLSQNQKNGIFHATPKHLNSLGIDTSKIVEVRLDNFQSTNFSGDSFQYKTKFKNRSFWPAIRCFSVYLSITGTDGSVLFKFVNEGCSTYGEYIIGEKSGDGRSEDLSRFVMNQNNWMNVTIVNENKTIVVTANDSIVFSDNYQKSIGKIIGTTLLFHGSGSVDYIHLTSANNQSVFCADFNE